MILIFSTYILTINVIFFILKKYVISVNTSIAEQSVNEFSKIFRISFVWIFLFPANSYDAGTYLKKEVEITPKVQV